MNDNISNIKNSVYRFNFSISKLTGDAKTTKFIPLPKGIVKYLEIDDNLANMGFVGSVVFNNFYGIMEKLGLGSGVNDSTSLFDINIENLDFKETNKGENSIQALTILQNNTEPSPNPIDKNAIYNFEEYSINLLRQKKLEPSELKASGKITDSIYNLLIKCFSNKNIIDKDSFDTYRESSNEMSVDSSILKSNSYYDFLTLLYKYLLLTGDKKSPGLLQLENFIEKGDTSTKETVIRKFRIMPLFERIRSLVSKLEANNKDLSEELLEEFTIGGESSAPSYRENIIETVTVLRPDFKYLYEHKWVNYTGVTSLLNLTDVIGVDVKYKNLREGFQQDALQNKLSNLPSREDIKDANTVEKILAFDYKVLDDENLLEDGITSMLYKSFIYDNTAVIFSTTGNPYRKPGRFIKLNGGYEEDRNSSATGYWFVIGVKHIFSNEIYSNEIIAVKIFIEGKNGLINADVVQKVNTSANNNVAPSARTNNTDFIDPNNSDNSLPDLPDSPESDDNAIDTSLLPDISQGEPVADPAPITQPTTNTPTSNTSDFISPNGTSGTSNQNDRQLPTQSDAGYDGPSNSLFPTPEGAPFIQDVDQSSGVTATILGPSDPDSPTTKRIQQLSAQWEQSRGQVGEVDPVVGARIAARNARRNAILERQ